ncbi:MAG TPA: HAD-IIB family hydrolase [Candidatus Paceibacterota bacterium]|nr:HAD-IIB family hydrolase [Candidatus Paceibacterota bacterium]
MPRAMMFDLDGTLAESKQPLTSGMASLLSQLLSRTKVAVVSGGALEQFLAQVVSKLPADAELGNLFLLPTSGAALYDWRNGAWHKVYEERLSEAEAAKIAAAMEEAARETSVVDLSSQSYGPRIEHRGGSVAFSALGQRAPVALKKEWDPDRAKRHALREAIASRLPGYSVAMGGATTIDVTKEGIDKAYGIHRLAELLHIKEEDMAYFGDELVAGGNDEAVFRTSAQARPVASPDETADAIRAALGG